jgi:hypothetical protein
MVDSDGRHQSSHELETPLASPHAQMHGGIATPSVTSEADLSAAVNYIVDECFFAVGQGVKDKSVQHPAIIWLRDHFRARFLETMRISGNSWLADRHRVTAMGRLLGKRAVHHAGDSPYIGRASVMKAAADIQKHCMLHAMRRARRLGLSATDDRRLYAGYWCVPPATILIGQQGEVAVQTDPRVPPRFDEEHQREQPHDLRVRGH